MPGLDLDTVWVGIGLGGQLMFGARFIVQWLASEKAKRSVVPIGFWYLSIAGSLILLAYAIHRHDPVFIIGQSTGTLIYARNLQLLSRQQTE